MGLRRQVTWFCCPYTRLGDTAHGLAITVGFQEKAPGHSVVIELCGRTMPDIDRSQTLYCPTCGEKAPTPEAIMTMDGLSR